MTPVSPVATWHRYGNGPGVASWFVSCINTNKTTNKFSKHALVKSENVGYRGHEPWESSGARIGIGPEGLSI